MSKKILINASHQEENRVAIVEDGILTELDIELEGREQTRGNIYKATVVRVESGLQAAFVDYGADRMGFLQIGEVHPDLYPEGAIEGNNRPRITDILKRGQEILVQITKEERGTKGAALTTNLSLAGRYMVLMPGSSTKGVSRKVENEAQRKEIKTAMNSIDIPDNTGYIVRTAGIGQSIDELHRDFKYLYGIHTKIIDLANSTKAPKLVYQESNLVIRSIRDYFSPDMDEVLIDDPIVFREAQDFFRSVMPEYLHLLKRHQEHRPIFSRYQIEEQIETITQNKVPLPSGGSIVIDITEALVAIDVNSGKMSSEKGIEATAFKTNIEAAAEVGRQLRLRDLGGLIVVDFIDMRDRKHNRDVEKTLKDSLKNDKARVSVGRISQFGLLEMSRQRIRAALAEGTFLLCPHCEGSGRVKSPEAQAVAFLRRIHTTCAKGVFEKVEAKVPSEVADYLLNAKREELFELEKSLKLTIDIKGQLNYISGQSDLEMYRRTKNTNEAKIIDAITSTDERPELSDEDRKPKETASDRPKNKRRRKTAAEKKSEMEAVATETQTTDIPTQSPAPSPEESPVEAAQESATENEPTTTTAGKTKRRRRRRKTAAEKKAEMEAAAAAAAGDQPTELPVAHPLESQDETPVNTVNESLTPGDHPTMPESKPKRRRRRKTAAEKRAEMEAATPTTPHHAPELIEEKAVDTISTSAEEEKQTTTTENKPKQRRGRKTAAEKKAEMEAAELLKDSATETVPTAQYEKSTETDPNIVTETKPEETVAKTKPRRRRKTVAEKRAEMEAAEQLKDSATKTAPTAHYEQLPETDTHSVAETKPEETVAKTKPRRRRKTVAEKRAEMEGEANQQATKVDVATVNRGDDRTAPPTTPPPPKEDNIVVEKPKRPRRKAADKKIEVITTSTDDATEK